MTIILSLIFSLGYGESICGDITQDTTWNADTDYLLTCQTFVKAGATLTIEAGTTIKSAPDDGSGLAPALVIEQGAMIMAEGTADAPITFTSVLSDAELAATPRGQWGGLIINGYAPISTTGGTNFVEGLEGIPYGGSDSEDSSGSLSYVRVWHGGRSIGQDNEINGITLAGVGSGTNVSHCEVAWNLDDGFEMFGGTVNLTYCSVVNVGDDAFDTDEGYQGKGQFLYVHRDADSDKAHEMDSKTNSDLDSQPRSHPQFSNVTIMGGGSNGNGEDGLRLREGTGGDFRNYIIFDVADDAIRNDNNGSEVVTQDLTVGTYPDYLYISPNTLMWNIENQLFDDFDDSATFAGTAVVANPGLVDNASLVDVTPLVSGAAYQDVDTVAADGFFTQTTFKGAFGSDNWLDGWSALSDVMGEAANVNTLCGDITEDTYLFAGTDYLLTCQTFVKAGATLTIEAGTTIKAAPDDGFGLAPALVIEQGAMIMAEGTADAPITFTSVLTDTELAATPRGQWGGLIINGYAPISTTGGTNFVEGLEGIPYGGSDAADNSGSLSYVRVWHGGRSIGQDNEINGITLAGVGSGTSVSHCEVAWNLDDGFEMFGGTVNLTYCSVVNVGDDAFDTDEGYQGKGQFLYVHRDADSDKAHEMDSKTNDDLDSQPRSHPQFSNVTVMGGGSNGNGEDGLRLREGTGGDFRNYIIFDVADDAIRNDDNGSEVVTQDLTAGTYPDYLYISPNTLMWNIGDQLFNDFGLDDSNHLENPSTFAGNAVVANPGLVDNASLVDVTPLASGAAYQDVDTVAADGFFTQTTFKGAFGSDNWLDGWSTLSDVMGEATDAPGALCGDITEDTYLFAGTDYTLTCQTFVKAGATLTIEAGTTIKSAPDDGAGLAPALVIEQGAMIMAEGTAAVSYTHLTLPTKA